MLVLVPPLMLKATGRTLFLETEKMDPRSLFRGQFAILGYKAAQGVAPASMAEESYKTGKPVYVTFTNDRPGKFVSVSLERPDLTSNQGCIVGRVRGSRWSWDKNNNDDVDFPQIAQYFADPKEAKEVEGLRGENLLAKVKVSKKCNAVLLGLEPR